MKTIEERAKEAGIVSQYKSDYRYDKKSVESGYIQGANEQNAIDIEKAKIAFNKTCGWLSTYPSCESWYNELVEKFMKNLEE